jgi:hypothetical protein
MPVTVPVTGDLTAQRSRCGSSWPSSGRRPVCRRLRSIPLTFADFGIEAPDLGFVSVEDQGSVEFLLRLTI